MDRIGTFVPIDLVNTVTAIDQLVKVETVNKVVRGGAFNGLSHQLIKIPDDAIRKANRFEASKLCVTTRVGELVFDQHRVASRGNGYSEMITFPTNHHLRGCNVNKLDLILPLSIVNGI